MTHYIDRNPSDSCGLVIHSSTEMDIMSVRTFSLTDIPKFCDGVNNSGGFTH